MRFQNQRIERNRQGITLLFVVSMIVLFMLMATTFLVVSSNYLRGAKSYAMSEMFERNPHNELEQVFYMLLRDTRDPNNPMRGHSILADIYGYFKTTVASVRPNSAQYVANSNNAFIQLVLVNANPALSTVKNTHIGQLMTVTSGGMQGVTCRIVSHVFNPAQGLHYFRIYPLLDDFYTDAASLLDALNAGPQVIINGRPFMGTGAGGTQATLGPAYDATDSFGAGNVNVPKLTQQALRPNRLGESEALFRQNYAGVGDVNEDYDVPDYQNMFLAGVIPIHPNDPNFGNGTYQVQTIPSFHRPALISHQGTLTGTLMRPNPATNPNFPSLMSLEYFGSNDVNTTQVGLRRRDINDLDGDGDTSEYVFEWDVDNDRDGRTDSVWIDPNLPVMTDSSGRTYKRLVAILCRDMDGLFNLNAHSNRFQLDGEYAADSTAMAVATESKDMAGALVTLSTLNPSADGFNSALPVGMGMGPAEINMKTIFDIGNRNADLARLMYGDNSIGVWGRNGQDAGQPIPRPGLPLAMVIDVNTRQRFSDMPLGIPQFSGSYGSYADIHGRFAFGVDYNGHPTFSLTTLNNTEIHDNEYERDLNHSAKGGWSKLNNGTAGIANYQDDAPFSYAEIERLLRGNDNDASTLPSRITDLAPNTFGLVNNSSDRERTRYFRMNFGGHSFDVPVIPTDIVGELRNQLISNGLSGIALEEALEEMMPLEFFAGQKYDLNRIFGKGDDDAGAGGDEDLIPDNHWGLWSQDLEATPSELDRIDEAIANEIDLFGNPVDLDNDGLVGNADRDEHLVRIKMAKHLYVLMRTILRTSGVESNQANIERVIGAGADFNLDGNTDQRDLAIFVAQWAINVVDFRDKDSIMTPFEFDLNPFNGWNVDGNPLYSDVWRDGQNNPIDNGSGSPIPEADRYVVFGCERPNLLMTETLAFHDRRTEDRDDEDAGGGNAETKANGDGDSDQRLKPEGSVFIELFNPNGVTNGRTDDIYVNRGNDVANNNGIFLGQLSVTNGVSDSAGTIANKPAPVWRIVMTQTDMDLDAGNATQRRNRRQNVERVIYFVYEDNGDMTIDPGEYTKAELRYDLPARVLRENGMFLLTQNVYNAIAAAPLASFNSAVIGTAGFQVNGGNTYINPLGRRTDVTDETSDVKYDQTRSILISPGAAAGAVVVRDMSAADGPIDYTKSTLGIPILDLNISEPIGGYNLNGRTLIDVVTTDAGGTQYIEKGFTDGMSAYVYDQPLDRNGRPAAAGDNQFDNFPRNSNTTVNSYRVLHLQRLANPLAGWHPETNPYLTVDTMPIDLSVFDGISSGDLGAFASGFGTKERGEQQGIQRNLWRVEPTRNQPAQADGSGSHFFSFYLENPNNIGEDESLGHTKLGAGDQINHSYDIINNSAYGAMAPTYPWLAWNNRPFVNQYELMLVPYTSSSQLLRRFTAQSNGTNIYRENTNSQTGGFGHLVNFFQGSQTSGAVGPDFHRIFDYTYVPSRFAGTELFLNNTVLGTPAAPDWYLDVDEAVNNADSGSVFDNNDPGFRAPRNFIRSMREPGKINLNTTYTSHIWDGLNGGYVGEGGHAYQAAGWPQFVDSRRGNQSGEILGAINAPTFFPTPFRSSNAGNLVAVGASLPHRPADNGLLRPSALPNVPLLDGAHPTVNANRHAYLKYLSRARLGNLTTTRSNVFAVWITVGYFEYDEATGQLGAELGSIDGEVERHRAFFMVDRSIPVGFEPGKNHNVDKTIMLRRYLE